MLSSLIEQLSSDPFNQQLNLRAAVEYENLKQTASAISFYQRAAEYGDGVYAYAALLRMSLCFQNQRDREATVMQNALQAVTLMPDRPEAYFRIAQIHERHSRWQECYTWASLGLTQIQSQDLPVDVGFPGMYGFTFEKAVAGWWIGRKDESLKLFLELLNQDIAPEYRTAVENNLSRLGVETDPINPLEPVITNYRKYYGKTAPIIFDIGTRDGDDANYLFTQLNCNKVFTIDGNQKAHAKTAQRYPQFNNLYCAVSDYDGTTTFYEVDSGDINMDGCSSIHADKILNEEHFQGKYKSVEVNVHRMDTLLKSLDLNGQIDIVKVDVEGFTWEVLQGFGERLNDVKLFHLETELAPTHENHKNTDEIADFMESKGFFLVDVSTDGSGGINGGIQDQIWVNPKLATRNKDAL